MNGVDLPGPASFRTASPLRPPHDHVFRNQSVGRRCTRAASGPRLWTETRIRRSSGPSLATSTKTSKYRSSSKAPVSSSSYSISSRDRPRFVSTRSAIRELPLRVLVEVLHVRVRRRRVDVEVVLLDVLAVIPLAVREAEQPLLEDRVSPVPEREGEAETLLVVRDPADAVLAPAVGARARLVVREVVPGVAVRAVVLANGPPLPLGEVGAPLLPRDPCLARVVQAPLFGAFGQAGVLGTRHGWDPPWSWRSDSSGGVRPRIGVKIQSRYSEEADSSAPGRTSGDVT